MCRSHVKSNYTHAHTARTARTHSTHTQHAHTNLLFDLCDCSQYQPTWSADQLYKMTTWRYTQELPTDVKQRLALMLKLPRHPPQTKPKRSNNIRIRPSGKLGIQEEGKKQRNTLVKVVCVISLRCLVCLFWFWIIHPYK